MRRLGCALALLPIAAGAQGSSALPRAWEVIDRHLDASGGRAALRKVESREVWASYEFPASRLRGELRVISARPDRLLIKMEYPEFGFGVTGFNGSIGWKAEPGSRARLIKDGALADIHADALFDRYDEENLVSAETVGIADFQGRRCFKLKIVRVPDRESSEYFDMGTGLFAGSEALRATDEGPVRWLTVVTGYQSTDGIKLPRQIRIRAGGVTQIIKVMRVTHNRVDPSVFAAPANLRGKGR